MFSHPTQPDIQYLDHDDDHNDDHDDDDDNDDYDDDDDGSHADCFARIPKFLPRTNWQR